jgi:hypothetical protein
MGETSMQIASPEGLRQKAAALRKIAESLRPGSKAHFNHYADRFIQQASDCELETRQSEARRGN